MKMAQKRFLKKLWSVCYLSTGGLLVYGGMSIHDNNERFYENVLMPASRYFCPETTHKVALAMTKYKLFPESAPDSPVLSTLFLGKNLSNPIGIAAGFDKNGEAVEGLRKIGFGFVEIGTVTPLAQPGNPKPRIFRLAEDKAIINRLGFNSDGHKEVLERITKISADESKVLGVNLGMNKRSATPVQDYVSGVENFGNSADYLVINVSSPNTPDLRELQDKENLKNLLSKVTEAKESLEGKKPKIFVKLAPDLNTKERREIADVLNKKEYGVDGLIISNTTISRPQKLQSKEFVNEQGGLSGEPMKDMSTQMIKEMYKLTKGKLPIIGVGGVSCGEDAYQKILAGASVLQIYTSFIYNGPPIVQRIKRELAEELSRNGYKNVNEAVGKGSK